MISVSPFLFVQMANFILLIFILNAILYKPIRNSLIERKKKIQDAEEAIEGAKRRADEAGQTFKTNPSEDHPS